ncbi:MAG TPA: winged helix-turn-helix domain-containing protein [Acidocella sp.]|nr:winged helix-turn-helix domain-containing protein [Acidocella sp.]
MPKAKEPDSTWTVTALAALAHEHRLAAYRLLVEAGPAGISAGEIAEKLGLVASSLTFHVQALLRAGLVSQRRASRHVIYAADFAAMNGLVLFLVSNCCDQESKVCPPLCNPALTSRSQAAQKQKKRSA